MTRNGAEVVRYRCPVCGKLRAAMASGTPCPACRSATLGADEWKERALCAGVPTAEWDPWFPAPGQTGAEGIDWCIVCPVRRKCAKAWLDERRLIPEAPSVQIRAGINVNDSDRKRVFTEMRAIAGDVALPAFVATDRPPRRPQAQKVPARPPMAGRCRNGHIRTEANTALRSDGSPRCLDCRAAEPSRRAAKAAAS